MIYIIYSCLFNNALLCNSSDDDYGDLSNVSEDNIRAINAQDIENAVEKCKLQFIHHKSESNGL